MNERRLSLSLQVKLASLVIHYEEAFGAGGHHFDRIAMDQIVNDAEVQKWLANFDKALLPVKRP